MQALRKLIKQEAHPTEKRGEPHDKYTRQVDAELSQMVWSHPGVNNWYKNKGGRIVTNPPWRLCHYRNLTAKFDAAEYRIAKIRCGAVESGVETSSRLSDEDRTEAR